ncbi:hypothetical protein EV144_103403 [Flavobacterium sp. 270]|nr:hypothetical protein EV144_103403 [Flavobacterium sp. 270]
MNQKIAIKTDHYFDQTDLSRFRKYSISCDEGGASKLMKLWKAEVNFRDKAMSIT